MILMSTATDTTGLNLSPDTLTLVIVSPDYTDLSWGMRDNPRESDADRTFYAIAADGDLWARLIVPESDPRHNGMWETTFNGENYRGWSIERRYLSPVAGEVTPEPASPVVLDRPAVVGDRVRLIDAGGDAYSSARVGDTGTVREIRNDGDPLLIVTMDDGHETSRYPSRFEVLASETGRARPASADLPTGEAREALPIEEAYPVGSVWNHYSYGDAPFTVTGHGGSGPIVLGKDADSIAQEWVRGALDRHGTFVGWDDTHTVPVEATESPVTFSQEDVDRLVREARESERESARQALEDFKEVANARAVEYAESNSLCGEFERCMEDIGLMGREDWHESHLTSYTVTFRITRVIDAATEDDAVATAREELDDSTPDWWESASLVESTRSD